MVPNPYRINKNATVPCNVSIYDILESTKIIKEMH